MLQFQTQGYNGYAVKYSPFFDSRIAVSASMNFGLVGNGRLYILNLTPNGIVAEQTYDTQDSLFDTAWSEAHENQVAVGCGDGSVKLFDISVPQFPVQSWQEHKREVFSVFWNLVAKDTFASSSWDGTIKIWSPHRPQSLTTLPTHSCTYSTAFSPHSPSVLSSVSSDSHLRIFDLRTPTSAANHLVSSIPIHTPLPHASQIQPVGSNRPPTAFQPSEALTHDWNKYRPNTIATAGVDRIIRTFDIRNYSAPLTMLQGHEYAIRKIAWSPHLPDVLLSASYDMSCRIWTDGSNGGVGRELGRMNAHTEFVTGVDWCLFGAEGWAASCSWDQRVLIWDAKSFMGGP
ncbi:peroxisomal targeting signal 2 receptor [Pseudogymnoascus destructans]|uniref:Peroxin-7 n=2 Tax=Pseudogymnoascus destructans TaxID=655981 RepID=L8FU35_PSED2|nr:peroxisomal targeting signal 2 receptor [Pseudogymnoascus destructans]ELR04402.1 hypothetical protein GMDG_01478 [Pseudogymnoascus destructans 20631-21]OAF61475.1 peroxisomal targeting signal 2 receptor [Pseudogymnoascus destructans]OBT78903.1 hypothetical protein VF21_02834 [Pseudogymnoascus sp. 05NY08]OBT91253.1 hypothetical protein VE02_00336 [Pseudogymnoascus sp. 03VT05]